MGKQEDKFIEKELGDITKDNYEDVASVISGQIKVKYDLDKDASEEIQQYIEQGV